MKAFVKDPKALLKMLPTAQNPFQIVWTSASFEAAQSVIVMDSSYNPPSRAHQALCRAACEQFGGTKPALLLLLSTANADKAVSAKPSAAQKLIMMHMMAHDLLAELPMDIAIAMINEAYFADKSRVIRNYWPATKLQFIIGFDTLVRFFDKKYYADMSAVLNGYFNTDESSILWASRPNANQDSSKDEQDFLSKPQCQPYLAAITQIKKDSQGISSTQARAAAKDRDSSRLEELCSETVAQYVYDEQLYKQD